MPTNPAASRRSRLHLILRDASVTFALLAGITIPTGMMLERDEAVEDDRRSAVLAYVQVAQAHAVMVAAAADVEPPVTEHLPEVHRAELIRLGREIRAIARSAAAEDYSVDSLEETVWSSREATHARHELLSDAEFVGYSDELARLSNDDDHGPLVARGELSSQAIVDGSHAAGPDTEPRAELLEFEELSDLPAVPPAPEPSPESPPLLYMGLGCLLAAGATAASTRVLEARSAATLRAREAAAAAEIEAARSPQERLRDELSSHLRELTLLEPSPHRDGAMTRTEALIRELDAEISLLRAPLALAEVHEIEPPTLSEDDERVCAILTRLDLAEAERAATPTSTPTPAPAPSPTS